MGRKSKVENMSWKNYGFNSKEEFIEWVKNSSSKEIKEKLNFPYYYYLKKCVDPEIFSIISNKNLSAKEMQEELKKKGINYTLNVVREIREVALKFGLVEKKIEEWNKEKLEKLLKEEAKKHGGKLTVKDVRPVIASVTKRIFGSWNKALEECGIKISYYASPLFDESLLLKLLEERGACFATELYEAEELKGYNKTTIKRHLRELNKKGEIKIKGSNLYRIIYLSGRGEDAFKFEIEKRRKGLERFSQLYMREGLKIEEDELKQLLEYAKTGRIIFERELSKNQRKFIYYQMKLKCYGFIMKEINGEVFYSTSSENLEALEKAIYFLKGN